MEERLCYEEQPEELDGVPLHYTHTQLQERNMQELGYTIRQQNLQAINIGEEGEGKGERKRERKRRRKRRIELNASKNYL